MQTLYTLALILLLPLIVVRLFIRSIKNPQYRQRIGERFARLPLRHGDKPCIWVHAVSVGEVIAASAMIKQLQHRYPGMDICVTTTTPTGSERVKAVFAERVYHYYLPYDVPSFNRAFFKAIRPQLLIIMETELWPNLLADCQRSGIAVLLANARLSAKSAKAYARVSLLSRSMLSKISYVAAQSKADARRFKLLGVQPERICVTGSIKFDIQVDAEVIARRDVLAAQLQIVNRRVAIFASTHQGEDEVILPIIKRLHQLHPDFLAIVVPRHLERFDTVYEHSQGHGLRVVRISQRQAISSNTQMILGDSMGDMLALFGLVDIAFIGGSLILHGGHNYLEAAAWGLPLLSGKSVHNFQAIAHQLQKAGALIVLEDHYQLERVLENYLADSASFIIMGQASKAVFENNHGALESLLALVAQQLK